MDAYDLIFLVCNRLDIAVFLREGEGRYTLAGPAPDFYRELFPAEEDGTPCREPWLHSGMLDFFLYDAEEFFAKQEDGQIMSGIWQEEGLSQPDAPLLTTALREKGRDLLILRRLTDEFLDRANILQKARENLLEHRSVKSSLEFYKKKSTYDPLTGLLNKDSFLEIMKGELEQPRESSPRLSLLMLDVDDFKAVNDTYGHLVGDVVLSSVGQLLHDSLRRHDIAARYGGEEFIVLASSPVEQAERLAEKLRSVIAEYRAPGVPSVTVSIGVTGYISGESGELFIQRADSALYDAKKAGKNRARLR